MRKKPYTKFIFLFLLIFGCLSALFTMPARAESPFPGEDSDGYYIDHEADEFLVYGDSDLNRLIFGI